MQIICWAIQGYLIVCVLRVVFSWINAEESTNSWVNFAYTISYALTEPLFASIRKSLPRPGDLPIDFTPAIVILVLTVLRQIVCR